MERLTDAQVAALTTATVNSVGAVRSGLIDGDEAETEYLLRALAAEVQQARQRRCDHCAHWYTDASYKPGFGHCTVASQSSAGWWFCADFKPL